MGSKLAWAIVTSRGVPDPESARLRKRDVDMSIFDEETGCTVQRVRVVTVSPTRADWGKA